MLIYQRQRLVDSYNYISWVAISEDNDATIVLRGGHYIDKGATAGLRRDELSGEPTVTLGFRATLFIK